MEEPRHAMMIEGRCMWCDCRYCWDGCYAEVPGYVYCVGWGWKPLDEAKDLFDAGATCRVDGKHGKGVIWSRTTRPADLLFSMARIQVGA